MRMASMAWCGHRGMCDACGSTDKCVEIRQVGGRPTRADIAVLVEYQFGLVAIGRRPEQGKGRPDIAGNSNDEGQVGAVDMRGLVGGFAEFDSEDLEPSGSEALAHPGKFLKSRRWSRRPTERKQHRPPLEHAAQRALDAVSLESEFGNGVRSGGDLTTELAHQDARGAGADEVDHVPALTRGQCGGKARHSPIGATPANPPEQIGRTVGE